MDANVCDKDLTYHYCNKNLPNIRSNIHNQPTVTIHRFYNIQYAMR